MHVGRTSGSTDGVPVIALGADAANQKAVQDFIANLVAGQSWK